MPSGAGGCLRATGRTRAPGVATAAVLTAVVLTAAAGCTSTPDTARAVPALEVSVSQPRADEGTRTLRGAVTNTGPRPVTVTSVTIAWPGFAPRPVTIDDGRLGPGDIAGFATEYGAARCDEQADEQADEPPTVTVVADGSERSVPLSPDDAAALRRLHVRECAAQHLARSAEVGLHLDERAHGGRLLGEVVVRRRPGSSDPVTVVDVAGSVLLRVSARADALPADLAESQQLLEVPVQVTSTRRCDAHAVTNSSQTFLFSIYVRTGDGEEQRVVVFPDPGPRRALVSMMDAACAAP